MTDFHDASFYLQIDADIYRTSYSAETVRAIKAVGMTQKRPARQKPGTVLVKLTVRVPDAAFLPLRPEAVIVIPEDMTATAPIEVEAVDPGESQ